MLSFSKRERIKENRSSPLMANYDRHFLYSTWREKTAIAKIYWGCSRRWRHVNLALSTYLQTSEPLECPSPPTHCQNLLLTLAPTDWASQSPPTLQPWQPQKEEELCVSHSCPIPPPQGKRERQANLLLTSLGSQPFTKKKLNGTSIGSNQSFLSTFWTASTAEAKPGGPHHMGYQNRCEGCSFRVSEEQHSQSCPQKYAKIFNFQIMWYLIFWSSLSWKQFFLTMFLFQLSTISLFKDISYL